MDISKIISSVDKAMHSLFQIILVVDRQGHKCQAVDFNLEFDNIADDPKDFDEFCENLNQNMHPVDRERFQRFVFPMNFPEELKTRVFVTMEARIRQKDDRYHWSEIIFCHATKEDSTVGGEYLVLLRDIDSEKKKELEEDARMRQMMQMKYDALFEENMKDDQTGCYNRKGEKYYEDMVLDEAKKTGKYVFVCVSDLSGLKHLNDTYGHETGDLAIAEISRQLKKTVPSGSRIVRTGGDEFLIFAALDKDSREPEQFSEAFDAEMKSYNESHPEHEFIVDASYGYVLEPVTDDMTDLDDYTRIADEKMYEMKMVRDPYRRD